MPLCLCLSVYFSVCLCLSISVSMHCAHTVFQVMFISSHPKRHQKNGNVTCPHVCPGDLLLCDKWKCQKTAHERDSDRSFLNDCDGCHVQEEHVWINVAKTVSLRSEPAVMSPRDCRAYLMRIKCFFAGFLQIPWTWNCNLTFPFYSFCPRSPTHSGSVGLCPPVYPWQSFLCETSVFEQRLSLLLLQLHLLSKKYKLIFKPVSVLPHRRLYLKGEASVRCRNLTKTVLLPFLLSSICCQTFVEVFFLFLSVPKMESRVWHHPLPQEHYIHKSTIIL